MPPPQHLNVLWISPSTETGNSRVDAGQGNNTLMGCRWRPLQRNAYKRGVDGLRSLITYSCIPGHAWDGYLSQKCCVDIDI